MIHPRVRQLADNLISHSIGLKPGEKILIEGFDSRNDFICALVQAVYNAGGMPFVHLKDQSVQRSLLMGLSAAQADVTAAHEASLMAQMDAYIGVRAADNTFETSDVPPEKMELYTSVVQKRVHGEIRVPKTRWVVMRWPTPSMAQHAAMSTEAFEDFFFDVCCLDYERMGRAMQPLVERLERANDVHIVGPGTDLRFSIAGMPAIPCDGHLNIPDGEVYTAPVRDSVNGTITYNTKSTYQGVSFENISFTFQNGKIVKATSSDTQRLNAILDTDEGARHVGEWALGVNPYIHRAMQDTLFDEKIAGSFHFTPGSCYDECDNGNKSAIHWDLVLIQTKEMGGGEIYLDGELIRKDGIFVPEALKGLNPENLV